MMKKILLVSASLVMTVMPSVARQLTPEEAYGRIGDDRAKVVAAMTQESSPELLEIAKTDAGNAAYYVFASGGKTLFVSADDVAVPLLGYIENPAVDLSAMPPQMKWWLGEYKRQIEWASENGVASLPGGEKTDFAPISPLCATTWDQEAPYNNLCPKRGSRTTVTGCVATAMAQVMKYFNWPENGNGSISYTWNGMNLSMDFSATTFDWDNMLNSYPLSTSGTAAQRTAVATLMQACGYSVEMNYGLASEGGSSASSYSLANVLVDNFGYDKGARMEWRDFYAIDDWNAMIYQNIAEVGPVLYGGSGSGGGHEFVCDGYSSGGLFHINWGWSGYYDGYFKLDALDPEGLGTGGGTGGFNYYQDVTLAIQKPQADSSYPVPYLGVDGDLEAKRSDRFVTLSAGNDGGFWNLGNYSGNFLIGMRMVNEEAEDTYYVTMDGMGNMCVTLSALSGWDSLGFSVPESVPGGTYHVAPVYKLDGVGEWIPFKTYYYSPSYTTISFPTTGVEELVTDGGDEGETRWYNALGQPVKDNPAQMGLYIKQVGGKTSKVIVR